LSTSLFSFSQPFLHAASLAGAQGFQQVQEKRRSPHSLSLSLKLPVVAAGKAKLRQ
jgi:hypothetical protein